MNFLPKNVEILISELSRLPGIGPKMAQRLTLYLLKVPQSDLDDLGLSVKDLKQGIQLCIECANWSESDTCRICDNVNRDKATIMVVEDPMDIIALERAGYQAQYHVLHGLISPIDGIGPDDLVVSPLLERIRAGRVKEIILATNSSVEGEATALYLKKIVSPLDIKISRLAHGLPMGGEIEYADEGTLSSALSGRTDY